ncbi:type IV pilus twitching motility protein PilT [Candidatus Sumerlaeota bacterium]|nr:type IV pilus twitching motility protein PilT [Candidatus Sumerlaeota bacterium]
MALLRQAFDEQASDVHLRAGSPPRIRVDGELLQVKGITPSEETLRSFFQGMVTDEQYRNFERVLELDFSHFVPGVCRVRANLYIERGQFCAALRLIPEKIPSIEDVGLPPSCAELTKLDRGLVLVTGPTGSGKSTTLAAMINHINANRRCHILTIEDPIEYYYEEKRAFITQRELDRDTRTFTGALRHSFRQDPDVVLIGEMRDQETIQTAITLAETGHLTFSTLHTGDAAQTITRIIDVMPPHQRDQVRLQLSNSLAAVISQRLLPRREKKGRIAAREVMICNRAIKNLIREGKTNQILSAIQTGAEEGMITMNVSLANLVRQGLVEAEVARTHADDPKDFAAKVGGR